MWPRLWGEKAKGERPETGGLRVPEKSRFFKESRRGLRAVGRTPRSRLGRTSWRDGETDTRDCSSRGSEAPAAFALPSDTVCRGGGAARMLPSPLGPRSSTSPRPAFSAGRWLFVCRSPVQRSPPVRTGRPRRRHQASASGVGPRRAHRRRRGGRGLPAVEGTRHEGRLLSATVVLAPVAFRDRSPVPANMQL